MDILGVVKTNVVDVLGLVRQNLFLKVNNIGVREIKPCIAVKSLLATAVLRLILLIEKIAGVVELDVLVIQTVLTP